MFTFILIVQTIVAVVMITVILMQRSEGGGLGIGGGGSPGGLMSARGAADFLTRTTAISAAMFVALSILLAAMAAGTRTPRAIDPSLQRQAPASAPANPATRPAVPGATPATPATQPPGAPAPTSNQAVPLAQ